MARVVRDDSVGIGVQEKEGKEKRDKEGGRVRYFAKQSTTSTINRTAKKKRRE
jgi:hypothetical protein